MPSSSSPNRAQQQRSLRPCRAQHFRAPPATGHHQGLRGRQRARAFADARGYQLACRGAGERIPLAATARTAGAVISPHRCPRHPLRHHSSIATALFTATATAATLAAATITATATIAAAATIATTSSTTADR